MYKTAKTTKKFLDVNANFKSKKIEIEPFDEC
jgi:hypothetical protein